MDDDIAEACKKVYSSCAGCRWMCIDEVDGVVSRKDIIVDYAAVKPNGSLLVCWRQNAYSTSELYAVNEVYSLIGTQQRVHGVFTSEEAAVKAAKKHFLDEKRIKIAELEAELKKLKEEVDNV